MTLIQATTLVLAIFAAVFAICSFVLSVITRLEVKYVVPPAHANPFPDFPMVPHSEPDDPPSPEDEKKVQKIMDNLENHDYDNLGTDDDILAGLGT